MEELFDVYDINGRHIGVKTRSFCHGENPGVWHKPVWIWIINDDGEILVQKRASTKKNNPNKFDMPSAGHVLVGENSIQGCIRETFEELGIKTKPEDYIFLREFIEESAHELAQVYLLKINTKIDEFFLQKEEVDSVKWLNKEEFKNLLYSDDFCPHDMEYRDWVYETICKYIK